MKLLKHLIVRSWIILYFNLLMTFQFTKAMNSIPNNYVHKSTAGLDSWKRAVPTNSIITESHEKGHYFLDLITDKKDDVWNFQSLLGYEPGKLLCVHRWKIWWAIPRVIPKHQSEADIPAETHLMVGMLSSGKYLLLLPLIDNHMGFCLEGSNSAVMGNSSSLQNTLRNNNLIINGHENSNADSGSKGEMLKRRALIISEGINLYSLLRTAFYLAKCHQNLQLNSNIPKPPKLNSLHSSQWGKGDLQRFVFQRGKGPHFIDSLGWCSWDSFYTDLSTTDILEGLASFKHTSVKPRFMILDDGWQHTTVNDHANGYQWGGRLTSFNANFKFSLDYTEKLKSGDLTLKVNTEIQIEQDIELAESVHRLKRLKDINSDEFVTEEHSLEEVVRRAKQEHGIKNLLVWHTLSGYWAGVHPEKEESDLEMDIDTTESMYRMAISGDLDREPFTIDGVGLVKSDYINDFFQDYHRVLHAMGVDGVKVDAQSIVPSLRTDSKSGWETVSEFHFALKHSVGNNFSPRTVSQDHDIETDDDKMENMHIEFPIIHCMCHSQGTLLSILALYPSSDCLENEDYSKIEICRKQIPVVRGSDDFWPTLPSTHGPHIFANAINSLLISFLGLHDWDMFQTGLGAPSYLHAASRAISGGPVYISDRPDEHDDNVLKLLAFPNGKVPRCLRSLRPVEEFIFSDPQKATNTPLLLQNINPAGGLVVGAFNVFGSVLENDRDFCRTVLFDEVIWSSATITNERKEIYRKHYNHWLDNITNINEKNTAKGSGGSSAVPWFSDPLFEKDLEIHALISPLYVEELAEWEWKDDEDANCYHASQVHMISRSEYTAYRFSDKQISLVNILEDHKDLTSAVSIAINKPHAYEIVTFSPKHYWKDHIHGVNNIVFSEWISIIGAVDLMNSGGAVLSVDLSYNNNSKVAKVRLMGGSGRYQILTSLELIVNQINIIAIDDSGDIESSTNNSELCKLNYKSIVYADWIVYEINLDSQKESEINYVTVELLF